MISVEQIQGQARSFMVDREKGEILLDKRELVWVHDNRDRFIGQGGGGNLVLHYKKDLIKCDTEEGLEKALEILEQDGGFKEEPV